ncbi:MAG: hypothetical protein M3137_00965 [Actinomycetota bacterium]|nr:hypothetical protein [Actinomycetota bacterium]
MYAVFTEVNADESHLEAGRRFLSEMAVPMVKDHGAKAAYWLAPQDGRGVSVVVFETEDEARKAAEPLKVGDQAGPTPEVTFRTVEVREVIASL